MVANPVDSIERLQEECKAWEKQHPKDFYAAPFKENGSINYMKWKCAIPGMVKTNWQGGVFTLTLEFPPDYPFNPPRCVFEPLIFHPNVFPSGKVSLSILEKGWTPQTTIKQILLGIQLLLADPNFQDPAQMEAFVIHSQGKHLYEEKIKEQTKKFTPSPT